MPEDVDTRPDPRRSRGKRHRLTDLIAVAVCAVDCGAETWAAVAGFDNAELTWFATSLDLQQGVACRNTCERVFARPDPEAFERCFAAWGDAIRGRRAVGNDPHRVLDVAFVADAVSRRRTSAESGGSP